MAGIATICSSIRFLATPISTLQEQLAYPNLIAPRLAYGSGEWSQILKFRKQGYSLILRPTPERNPDYRLNSGRRLRYTEATSG